MQNLRLPTHKELWQLTRYVQKLNDWPVAIAEYDLALWFIAVFDAYSICGHRGKTLVAINPDGITHLFAWNQYGQLYRLSTHMSMTVDSLQRC